MLPRSGHVRLHRIWAFAALEEELTPSEHIHIIYCDECQLALTVCLQTNTFGGVLKKLNREDDTNIPDDDQSSRAG